jgi:hypothetical protein
LPFLFVSYFSDEFVVNIGDLEFDLHVRRRKKLRANCLHKRIIFFDACDLTRTERVKFASNFVTEFGEETKIHLNATDLSCVEIHEEPILDFIPGEMLALNFSSCFNPHCLIGRILKNMREEMSLLVEHLVILVSEIVDEINLNDFSKAIKADE